MISDILRKFATSIPNLTRRMKNDHKIYMIFLFALMLLMACSTESDRVAQEDSNQTIGFGAYLMRAREEGNGTRTVYPTTEGATGEITTANDKLRTLGFGVAAQYTEATAWADYTKTTPFNFMWNQQVGWDASLSAWTYTPVKYWPNDNQPADHDGATGSQEHSYLSFFAYAPFAPATELPATGHDDATADGIIEMSPNSTNADASYLYYRTSIDKPFDVEESVDLLWATSQDRYKMDGSGYVNGHVELMFKHALTRVGIYVKALIDRTENHTSPAYDTELDPNTRIFIESATLTTPDFYPEGKLMLAPADATPTVPRWDFTGLSALKKEGLTFDNDASNATPDVRYALRYAAPNVPTHHDWVGQDAGTELYDYEQAREDFDAMEQGVTHEEQQLAASQAEFMFPPAGTSKQLTVRLVYRVITYDRNLVLNNPKYYSLVQNDITATLPSFAWEPNKKYKILLEPGLTSAKFTLAEITEWGEVIILSSVVKEWDTVTKEVNID